jgi:hypothetical protein
VTPETISDELGASADKMRVTVPGFRVVEHAVDEAWFSFPHPGGQIAVLLTM